MTNFSELVRSGDWKNEKHVPVIKAPEKAESGQEITITVEVGADIPHPNTTEHHIRWIKLFFQPEEGFVYELGDYQFTAHGEAVAGANEGPAFSQPKASVPVKLAQSGTLIALSYCNIHGLWQSAQKIAIE